MLYRFIFRLVYHILFVIASIILSIIFSHTKSYSFLRKVLCVILCMEPTSSPTFPNQHIGFGIPPGEALECPFLISVKLNSGPASVDPVANWIIDHIPAVFNLNEVKTGMKCLWSGSGLAYFTFDEIKNWIDPFSRCHLLSLSAGLCCF